MLKMVKNVENVRNKIILFFEKNLLDIMYI